MNKLAAMMTFRRVAELGGFAAAARDLDLSNAAVSKHVRELELELGAVLFARTTRRLSLTEAGRTYLAHCIRILDQITAAEEELGDLRGRPRGRLRISAPMSFGILHIAPLLADFAARYTDIRLDLALDDRVVDLVDAGFDIGLRVRASLPDSSLAARKLCDIERVVVAAPAYLERHGTPATPDDLAAHRLLGYSLADDPDSWLFHSGDQVRAFEIDPFVRANSALALRELCLRGSGIAYTPRFVVDADIRRGGLVPLLAAYPSPVYALHAVLPAGRALAPKVRVFVDYLADRFASAMW